MPGIQKGSGYNFCFEMLGVKPLIGILCKKKSNRISYILTSIVINNLREDIPIGQVDRLGGLVVIAPERRAGDPGSIPGPGEKFFS